MNARRFSQLAALPFIAASLIACGSDECSGGACAYENVTLTASLPSIGPATWTVTVCQNGDCKSASITSAQPQVAAGGLIVAYAQEAGSWLLRVSAHANNPANGDKWSLKVATEAGDVVMEDERPVNYDSRHVDECLTCTSAAVAF